MFTKAYTAPKHNKQTKWLSMPEDIQKRIWKFLSPVEVFKQQVICKKYRDMLEESYESFWKEIHTRYESIFIFIIFNYFDFILYLGGLLFVFSLSLVFFFIGTFFC